MRRDKDVSYGNVRVVLTSDAIGHCIPFFAALSSAQKCFKTLPYAGGVVLVLMIAFALWVRSVPPKQPSIKVSNVQTNAAADMGMSRPEDDPLLQAKLQEAIKEAEAKMAADKGTADEATAGDVTAESGGETIEL